MNGRARISEMDPVATSIHRLAVLLEAGLPPGRAWAFASDAAPDAPAERDGEAHKGQGLSSEDVAAELSERGGAWRDVATAWSVAATVGAPLAPALRAVVDALRDAEQARDDVDVALAGPATTARLVGWLPLLALVLVAAFGFDVTAALASPLGVFCVVLGAGFMTLGHRWTRRLVRRAQPPEGIAGWESELVCIALRGGVSIDRAVDVVTSAGCAGAAAATAEILHLSRASGAPAAELLRADAADRRRRARTEGKLRAARLAASLLLPLGACTLPAFLLLGVGPMLLSVFAAAPLDI